jgi:hypothetical protein
MQSFALTMSFFTMYLYLVLGLPFSSATHPFERLRPQNLYPATNYDASLSFNSAGFGGSRYTSPENVYSNLQPDPQFSRPGEGRVSWGLPSTSITCSENELPIPDCEAAIDFIPTGHLILDPKDAHSLGTIESQESVKYKATLPRPLRKFHLPAAFRAGGCVVYVGQSYNINSRAPEIKAPMKPPTGFSVAMFLYHTIWPNSRRLADSILKRCGSRGGFIITDSSPESAKEAFKTFRYVVVVGSPKKDPWSHTLKDYNLYE